MKKREDSPSPKVGKKTSKRRKTEESPFSSSCCSSSNSTKIFSEVCENSISPKSFTNKHMMETGSTSSSSSSLGMLGAVSKTSATSSVFSSSPPSPPPSKTDHLLHQSVRRCEKTTEFNLSGTRFEIDAKYKPIKAIGHGAYGIVIACRNDETEEKVAIKKIPGAFNDIIEAKRVLREIKLLLTFEHDNLMHALEILRPPSSSKFQDIYIVSPLMETDLHRIIYSKQDLSDDHTQYFVYQILRALRYMHSAEVLHRDLKPSNVLLNSNCDLKICDFGTCVCVCVCVCV
jgi:hypothetical protein